MKSEKYVIYTSCISLILAGAIGLWDYMSLSGFSWPTLIIMVLLVLSLPISVIQATASIERKLDEANRVKDVYKKRIQELESIHK